MSPFSFKVFNLLALLKEKSEWKRMLNAGITELEMSRGLLFKRLAC